MKAFLFETGTCCCDGHTFCVVIASSEEEAVSQLGTKINEKGGLVITEELKKQFEITPEDLKNNPYYLTEIPIFSETYSVQ